MRSWLASCTLNSVYSSNSLVPSRLPAPQLRCNGWLWAEPRGQYIVDTPTWSTHARLICIFNIRLYIVSRKVHSDRSDVERGRARIILWNLVLRQASGHIYMSKRSDHELTDSETVKRQVKSYWSQMSIVNRRQLLPGLCFYGVEVQCACAVLLIAWTTAFLRSKVSPVVQSSSPVQ